ncbi:unnamed protein product [Clonostachys solani]|uniref:Uncharacterized protein n=1 Tax=Clonostachys solani TaxID=160281 RepID=A0A9N9ZNM6_9HYPO|nr:unnamed protein product [Clonostachys solani]
MPGIPKTKGCSVCKAKKIKVINWIGNTSILADEKCNCSFVSISNREKYLNRLMIVCDEKWPTCTACRHSKRTCPGPSPLVTYAYRSQEPFNENFNNTKLPFPNLLASTWVENSLPPEERSCHNHNHQSKKYKPIRPRLPTKSRGVLISNGSPRASPTTRLSQLAASLVSVLNTSTDLGDAAHLSILSFVPPRLQESQCLSDSVAFWCSSQLDDRRCLMKPSVETLRSYSKALQSLRQALRSKQVYCPETLATVVILQRAGTSFDNAVKLDSVAHAKGMSELIVQRGPPRLDDDLDASLASELGSSLFCWCDKLGGQEVPKTMDAEEIKVEGPLISASEEALIQGTFGKMADCMTHVKIVHNDPDPENMKVLASDLLAQIRLWNQGFSLAIDQIEKRFTKQGLMEVIPDKDFFLKEKYHLRSIAATQFLLEVLVLQIIIAKVLHSFSSFCASPDDTALYFERYRKLSIKYWMLIPHLKASHIKASQIVSCTFSLTFEAAENDLERDQVLDAVMTFDQYMGKFKRHRKLLEDRVLQTAKQLTGRGGVLPIQVWISGQRESKTRKKTKKIASNPRWVTNSSHILHGCLFFERLLDT